MGRSSSGPLPFSHGPILFVGMSVLQDEIVHFNERDAARNGIGYLRGLDIMNMALNLTDTANLYGTRHSALWVPSIPREPVLLETTTDHCGEQKPTLVPLISMDSLMDQTRQESF